MFKNTIFKILILLPFLLASTVYAQSITETEVKIDISPDLSTKVVYEFIFSSTDSINLVDGVELSIPFQNIRNLKAFRSNQRIDVEIIDKQIYSKIKASFRLNPVYPNRVEKIRLEFESDSILETVQNSYTFKLPKTPTEKLLYQITYPSKLGRPIFSNSNTYTINSLDNNLQIVTSDNTGIFFVWGEENQLDISFVSTVQKSSVEGYYLFNILPSISRQSHIYSTMYGADLGLYDKFKNNYALVRIGPEIKPFNFSARVFIRSNSYESETTPFYSISLENLPQQNIQKLSENLKKEVDVLDKFRDIYADILSLQNDFDLENYFPTEFKQSSKEVSSIFSLNTQVESCLALVHFGYQLEIKGLIKFGYLIYADSLGLEFGQPHLWCEFSYKDKVYIFDPLAQRRTQFSFSATSPLDRISMGIWHPSQRYNNVLGLLSGEIQEIFKTNLKVPNLSQQSVELLVSDFPKESVSATQQTGNLVFRSNSPYFTSFNQLKLNSKDYSKSLELLPEMFFGAIPLGNSVLPFSGMLEEDIFFSGNKKNIVEAYSDTLTKSISAQLDLMLIPNSDLINSFNFLSLSIFFGLAILVFGISFVLFKKLKIRTQKYKT